MKIFVVDDSNVIRRTATKILEAAGHEVSAAGDGYEALAAIAGFRPDVIFMDVSMPRLDGYQACEIIRKSPCRNARIILLSGNGGLHDVAHGRMAGANAYLQKPFTLEDLLGALN